MINGKCAKILLFCGVELMLVVFKSVKKRRAVSALFLGFKLGGVLRTDLCNF